MAILTPQNWSETIEQLVLVRNQSIRWSWMAIREGGKWGLLSLTVRAGTLQMRTRTFESDNICIHSESISIDDARARLLERTVGPSVGKPSDLHFELSGTTYSPFWIKPGMNYGMGATARWPEYYTAWSIRDADPLRHKVQWWDPFRASGSQFRSLLEAAFIHLYGSRPAFGTDAIQDSVVIRLPYPYRIGRVDFSDGQLTTEVEWSGFTPREGINLHLTSRRKLDQLEPDDDERPVPVFGGSLSFEVGDAPAETILFLNDPQYMQACDQREWPSKEAAAVEAQPLVLEPDEQSALPEVVNLREATPRAFEKLTDDIALQAMLRGRWIEASLCMQASYSLAATILIGSVMEGALIAVARQRAVEASQLPGSPKGPIEKWTLQALVQVARELRWINPAMGHFMDVVRTLRNLVHPWAEYQREEVPDAAVVRLCYLTVEEVLKQLAATDPRTLPFGEQSVAPARTNQAPR